MNSSEAVIKRINDLCFEKRMSYYALAYRSAIPKSTLMNIMNGTNPTISTLNKICNGLEMNLMEFLRNDAELKQLREEWKKQSGSNFPPYNYDEYAGIDDYKQKIRKELEENRKK